MTTANTHISVIAMKIKELAGAAKRLVFVSGNFNTLHPGHLRLLRFAAECGDFLIVGVSGDNAEGALVPKELRLEGVQAISFVNFAFTMVSSPETYIQELQPLVVVKGKEHEGLSNVEQAAVENYGGKLLFSSGEMQFSSIDLLNGDMVSPKNSSILRPRDFPYRHGFTTESLGAVIDSFKGLKVTVIGDLIVDEYIECDPVGMSQEDPTIVVTPIKHERFVGGAGIVAAHARSLGAEVQYVSVSGKDLTAEFAREKLCEYGVQVEIFEDETRPTTLKQRYRAAGKTLLRVSHLRQRAISQELSDKILDIVNSALLTTDLLIFSDFNYGCLPQNLVDEIVDSCKKRGVLMVADSQSSSQVGDVSRFKEMLLLTPTEREARLALGDFSSGLVVLAENLRKKTGAKYITLTLGAEGLLAHSLSGTNQKEMFTDRLPAFNPTPKDSAGAGDSFLACSAMSLAVGADFWQSIYLGSIAAACQVARVGNIPLSPRDIELELAE